MKGSLLVALFCSSIAGLVQGSPLLQSVHDPTSLRRRGLKPATPSAEYKGKGNRFTVTLGQAAHAFKPTTLNASVGDFITFRFYPNQHSATLGDYDFPCKPWGYVHAGAADVWSGLIDTPGVTANLKEWIYEVKSTEPQFFYCSAKGSCSGNGMVFALNPNKTQTLEVYQKGAIVAPYELSPGENPPPEGGVSATPTGTSSAPTSTVVVEEEQQSSHGLSAGAIAGIAVGAVGAIALVGILFFLVGRGRKKDSETIKPEAAPALGDQTAATYTDYPVHPPPDYDGRALSPVPPGASPQMVQTGWTNIYKPPVSPGLPSPHDPMHPGAVSPRPGHQSWAPSELSAAPAASAAVEIYTPAADERKSTPQEADQGEKTDKTEKAKKTDKAEKAKKADKADKKK